MPINPCAINRNYVGNRYKLVDDVINAKGLQGAFMKFKSSQGENLNNVVTAVGTAGVAPIFIINNPLAKEDLDTKKYTAARQPISAAIALAFQIPIMNAYNSVIDRAAVTWGLDKCDLHAKPLESYIKDGVRQEYKIYKDELALQGLKPKEKKSVKIKELIKIKQDNAFHADLDAYRADVKVGNIPEIMKTAIENGEFKMPDLVSTNDIKKAEGQIFNDYITKKFNVNPATDLINDSGEVIKVGSLDDIKRAVNKKVLKKYGIVIDKEIKKEIKARIKAEVDALALKNLTNHVHSETKIKLYSTRIYKEAKNELADYKRELIINKTPKDEMKKLMQAKNDELFDKLIKHAKDLFARSPESVAHTDMTLDINEAFTLVKKLEYKKESKSETDKLIKCLKTTHGSTYSEVEQSVKVKKWLIARINKSEKFLADFKQKSGLLVGLAILPLTCGLLNWAYPRIMEEWFPHLAHAKAASKAKEAK